MTEQTGQQDFGARVKGVTIVKPIVYGNVARFLGMTREDGHTHEWTIYLKSYDNDDMSSYIKKVNFKLHESYANPNRILTAPPYKVVESGWGEFEVVIKIYFYDAAERPITIYHHLKLFKQHPVVADYLVSEFYDELIFAEPSSWLYERLQAARSLPLALTEPVETDFEEKKSQQLDTILSAKQQIRTEIEDLRKRIDSTKEEVAKYKTEIAKKNATPEA